MFLEKWIHERIRQDVEFSQHKGGENLKEITRQEVEEFQLFKLRKTLNYAHEKSGFYRDLFTKNAVDPEDVRSLQDLAKIPFTEPAVIAESPYKLLCIPLGEIARAFTLATTGTTGPPKKVFFTEKDIETITDSMAAVMKTALTCGGLSAERCVVQLFMPNGTPTSQADLISRGVKKMDGIPIIGDITMSTEEQVEAIKRARPDMLMGSAFRIYRITQIGRQFYNLGRIGVKIIFITSEYLSTPMRENLQTYWNGEVYHHYGMTETGLAAAIECQAHNGFHFDEADFLFEVVDPLTGEILKSGEEGELVFTTLSREGMPLIRYRTGDLACLISEPCGCGASTLQRISKVTKRIKSIVQVGKGEIIYPTLFDDVLYEIPNLVDYRVFLDRTEDKECLSFKIEVAGGQSIPLEEMKRVILKIPSIRKNIEADLMTEPRIELVKQGALRRTGRAKQRIIDERHRTQYQ
jgi:phenylacetate-coenzyme A ligase PaaK-like adenylate-forming protein